MKLSIFLGTLASIVTILAYFNIDANSSEPSFNIKGNNNYQVNASGDVIISKDTYENQKNSYPFDCGKKEMVLIKPNTLGSINVDSYSQMKEAIRTNNNKVINKLKYNGLITEIKSPTKACIENIAFHWYRVKVKVQGYDLNYWIDERAYSKID